MGWVQNKSFFQLISLVHRGEHIGFWPETAL